MADDKHNQDDLFARYWEQLAADPAAPPPPALDPDLADRLRQMPPPDPDAAFIATLSRKLEALPLPNTAPEPEAAPLLRSGLPTRPVRRATHHPYAPYIAMAAMLVVLLAGTVLLSGMLAGRQKVMTNGIGPVSGVGGIGGTEVITNPDEIMNRNSSVLNNPTVQSFAATLVLTVPFSGQDAVIVRNSDIWYQSPNSWHTKSIDTMIIKSQLTKQRTFEQISNSNASWSTDSAEGTPQSAIEFNSLSEPKYELTGPAFGGADCGSLGYILRGSDTVAGRETYVIDYISLSCNSPYLPTPTPSTPYVIARAWIDKQTFLTLKYSTDNVDNSFTPTMEVTSIQYNGTLDASLFAMPTATPVPPISLADARRKVNYSVFVPTYLPSEIAPAPLRSDLVSSATSSVNLFYYTSDGKLSLDISNSPAGKLDLTNATENRIGTTTLPNGITAYFYYTRPNCVTSYGIDNGPYGSFSEGRLSILWLQDGTRISIGGARTWSNGFQLTQDELVKIAASVLSTADVGQMAWPPTMPALPSPRPTDTDCPTIVPAAAPTGDLPEAVPTGVPLLPNPQPTANTNS